jgi:hypothetical protein
VTRRSRLNDGRQSIAYREWEHHGISLDKIVISRAATDLLFRSTGTTLWARKRYYLYIPASRSRTPYTGMTKVGPALSLGMTIVEEPIKRREG